MTADLVAALECDVGQWSSGLEQSAVDAEQSSDRVIKVIHEQEASWSAMVANVLPSLAKLGAGLANMAAAGYALTQQRELIATISTGWTVSAASALNYGRTALSAASWVYPPLKGIALAVTAATIAYKVGTNDIVQSAFKQSEVGQKLIANYDELRGAVGRVGSSMSNIAESGVQAVTDGFTALSTQAIEGVVYLAQYDPSVQAVSHGLSLLADGMEWAATKTDEFNEMLPVIKLYTENLGNVSAETAQKFYEEGQSLKEIAAETERVIALQEAHRNSYQTLAQIQAQATAAAEHSAEVQRLGSLTSIEAIEKEEDALRKKAAAAIQAGKPMDERKLQDLFGTLATQRQGVESGRIKPKEEKDSYATSAIQAAERALLQLEQGEIAVALATARAKGVQEEEIEVLRKKLEAVDVAKSAAEALAKSQQAAAQQQQRQEAAQQQAASRIESMRDEIDLLTGAATKADIAMRDLYRQGAAEEQIAEIGELTARVEQLREAADKKPRNKEEGGNTAALQGSSAAASIVLRGVTDRSNPNAKLETLQQQAVIALNQIARRDPVSIEVEEVNL